MIDSDLGHSGALFTRLSTISTVIFLIVGKLDVQTINPHTPQTT